MLPICWICRIAGSQTATLIPPDGVDAIRHKVPGQSPNNRIDQAKRELALSLVRKDYPYFRTTLVTEMLAERHGF